MYCANLLGIATVDVFFSCNEPLTLFEVQLLATVSIHLVPGIDCNHCGVIEFLTDCFIRLQLSRARGARSRSLLFVLPTYKIMALALSA